MKRFALIIAALMLLSACACAVPDSGWTPSGLSTSAPVQRTSDPGSPFATAAPTEAPEPDGRVSFQTVDINGSPISLQRLSDAKVIMINFFETWCPPCMGELPDLETLYERYKDSGLVILGVYSSSDTDAVRSVVEGNGITYPVFEITDSLRDLQTDYVPTTVFINASGELLLDEPCIGSRDLSGWESEILPLLQQ